MVPGYRDRHRAEHVDDVVLQGDVRDGFGNADTATANRAVQRIRGGDQRADGRAGERGEPCGAGRHTAARRNHDSAFE